MPLGVLATLLAPTVERERVCLVGPKLGKAERSTPGCDEGSQHIARTTTPMASAGASNDANATATQAMLRAVPSSRPVGPRNQEVKRAVMRERA
jgi:hypothetical protein